MKLLYFKGSHPNFGDDLNYWLWPKLLPDFFDEDESTVFCGIGSIIGADVVLHYGAARKIVFGSGFVPEYHPAQDVHGPDWDVFFVRGPRTARALNLPDNLALGDSAILIRSVMQPGTYKGEHISFIPHWESMERGNWEKPCRLAGIHLIDPRRSVEEVLADLLRSKLVIAEAMHGAIVADALRIPWVPVVPMNKVHRNKWLDWAEALRINLCPHKVCPSSLTEARLSFMRKPIEKSPFVGIAETALVHMAAHGLSKLAKAEPCLSDDAAIRSVHEKMLYHLAKLKEKYRKS